MEKAPIESEAAMEQVQQWADGLDKVAILLGHRFPRLSRASGRCPTCAGF